MAPLVGRRAVDWQPSAWQSSLFGEDEPSAEDPGSRFAPIRNADRIALDDTAWVDVVSRWCRGADALFEDLIQPGAVPWLAQRRPMHERVVATPRLLSWYGERDPLPDSRLQHALDALNARYRQELGEDLVTAGLCLYRDGRDSVAWHGDRIGRSSQEDTLVAILSLGSPRVLSLRPNGGSTRHRLSVGHGDLVVMGGACQRTWEHQIAKTAQQVGPRISVQFRTRGVR